MLFSLFPFFFFFCMFFFFFGGILFCFLVFSFFFWTFFFFFFLIVPFVFFTTLSGTRRPVWASVVLPRSLHRRPSCPVWKMDETSPLISQQSFFPPLFFQELRVPSRSEGCAPMNLVYPLVEGCFFAYCAIFSIIFFFFFAFFSFYLWSW